MSYVKVGYGRCRAKVGEAHHFAKLTRARVLEMRRRRLMNREALTDIARSEGVTPSTAYKAIAGHTWKSE